MGISWDLKAARIESWSRFIHNAGDGHTTIHKGIIMAIPRIPNINVGWVVHSYIFPLFYDHGASEG